MVEDTVQIHNIQRHKKYSAGLPQPWSFTCVFTGAFIEAGPKLSIFLFLCFP